MTDLNRKTWQEFEDAVERLHRKFHKSAVVTRNDHLAGKISGRIRQIDVSVRHHLGPSEVLIIVECKRHGRKIDLEEMGAFISKKEDVGAHMGIMVAERGFTKGAERLAQGKGVKVYKLRDTQHDHWPEDVTFKIFVESCTIFVQGWAVRNQDGTNPVFDPGQQIHLFDSQHPDREITINDVMRNMWKKEGQRDGEFAFTFRCEERSDTLNAPQHYRLSVSFRVETKRFSRDASLQLLGLVETDETTHTDAFKIATQPGRSATFYSEPGFWKKLKARFAVLLTTSDVVWPDQAGKGQSLAERQLISTFPEVYLEIRAKAGEKPISLRLGGKRKPALESNSLQRAAFETDFD